MSVRVEPHTKKFLERGINSFSKRDLEIYEDYNNGSEAYINSLKRDELLLKEEAFEIELKLQNAKGVYRKVK